MLLRSQITVEVHVSLSEKRPPSEYNLFQTSVKGMGYTKKQIGELWAEKKNANDYTDLILELNDEPKRELYGAAKLMKEMKGCKGVKMTNITKQLKGAKGLCLKN